MEFSNLVGLPPPFHFHFQKDLAKRSVAAAISMQEMTLAGKDSHDTVQTISIAWTTGPLANIIQYNIIQRIRGTILYPTHHQ